MRRILSVAIAIILGVLSGEIVVHGLAAYGAGLWIIGVILGGIVTYVAIDLRKSSAIVIHRYRVALVWRKRLLDMWTVVRMSVGMALEETFSWYRVYYSVCASLGIVVSHVFFSP